ncbi:molybdopterin-dependent oxidoreductase, partial [Actinocorallia lasiicapitis]
EVARVWGVGALPAEPGRDTDSVLAAAATGEIEALVIGGVDLYDLADPQAAAAALAETQFIVSLEQRVSAITDRADVVLPVATVTEKSGTFVNWEGRGRPFETALKVPGLMSDLKVLGAIADEMDVHLGLPDPAAVRRELSELGSYRGIRPAAPHQLAEFSFSPGDGEAVLATWKLLLDDGRMQDGEPHLHGTARPCVAKISAKTAAENGIDGEVTVSTARGSITVPAESADLPDGVIWLPANSSGINLLRDLGAATGSLVKIDSTAKSGGVR